MILACDPGLHGAFACYDGRSLSVRDMPVKTAWVGGREKLVIDEAGVAALFRPGPFLPPLLVVEQVGGMPSQSGPAAFVFGRGVGVIIGLARAAGMRIEEIPPATWKSATKTSHDKNKARARASELFPAHYNDWPLKKHDGRAEAAILAWYGWKVFGPAAEVLS